jgi:hypothetical protein
MIEENNSPYSKICLTEENPIAEAAFKDFYAFIKSSPRFEWMGIGDINDEYDRHRLAVYLSEVNVPAQFRHSMTQTLRPWSRAERDNSVLIDVYFMRNSDPRETLKERAIMDMTERYRDPVSKGPFWEEYFS